MRALVVLLLLAAPTQGADLEAAADWLQRQPASAATLEGLHALGVDSFRSGHLLQFTVPAETDDPTHGARALHAVATSGYDLTTVPLGGLVDVAARLAERGPAVLDQGRVATMAFHLLAVHAAGAPSKEPELAMLEAVAGSQDGGFPCNQRDVGIDCTGFAVAALAAFGHPLDERAARAALLATYNDTTGAFADNAENQAWAIIALGHLGGAPPKAWSWLDSFQTEAGSFLHRHDGTGLELFATRDAVLAYAGFPGPRFAAPVWHATPTQDGLWLHAEGDEVTWTIIGPAGVRTVQEPDTVIPDPVNTRAYLRVEGNGTHGRAVHIGPQLHGDPGAPGLASPILLLALFLLAKRSKRP